MGPGKTPTEDIFTLNNYFMILEAQFREQDIVFEALFNGLHYEYALGLISVFHPMSFHPAPVSHRQVDKLTSFCQIKNMYLYPLGSSSVNSIFIPSFNK